MQKKIPVVQSKPSSAIFEVIKSFFILMIPLLFLKKMFFPGLQECDWFLKDGDSNYSEVLQFD